MSRIVPFEDPLLHPPTPPIPQTNEPPAPASVQVDDGPIPFKSASQDSPSVFSPPPQLPFRGQTPSSQPSNPRSSTSSNSNKSHANENEPQPASFVDPLSAALEEDARDRPISPSINTIVANSSIPTEIPTHMASPPLPNRPSSIGGTSFSAFQAFSSALQPPTTSGTPITDSPLGTPSPNVPLDEGFAQKDPIGLGLEDPAQGSNTPTNQWAKRHSIGISTHPSGMSLGISIDQGDLVRQDLKSPDQEYRQSPVTVSHLSSPTAQSPQNFNRPQQPLHIKPADQTREQVMSPGFNVPPSPMRREGLPVLNSQNMFHDITMSDPLNDLMVKHIPAEHRVLRDWNALTEAEQRQGSRAEILHELTINNSWRAMTRYTRAQILATPPDQILDLINLWYVRLLALVKLGQYEMAQAELDQLGNLRGPQYRFESYPPDMFTSVRYGQEGCPRKGSMVPFELFVLKARLQGHLGDIYEAIDQLYDLIMRCKKFEAVCRVGGDTVGVHQWQDLTGQLHLLVLNYLVELKDFPSATKHARDLAARYPHDINFHSGLGRLYLQLGDLDQAEKVFKNVEDMVKKHPEHSHFKLQLIMNKALLAVTQGHWQVAKTAFEEVLVYEPENLAATNNLAVCELYAGQVDVSISRLEKLMFAYPTSAGASEPLVFNMATLYELRTEGSLRRKQQMMLEVSKWAGDQFNVGMFKI
ncbi:Trafficking protein particle complex subunit 12 [Podila epicladia]|nr:Trafficking protein particle complex subunit 12 [Podila epicladia]